ncbi:MAG: ABC transporter ATP-binding protein [Aphanocapsa feldmannii 288cV]|nr:MAG: ABC transporter ATP-binding protein [Aphanocapsa feldmannii 288cV]
MPDPDGEVPLRIQRLCLNWANGARVLDHCNLTLPRPGLWMLVGRNGCGKSTLLRVLCGLAKADGGCIESSHRPALVFQNPDHQLLLPSAQADLALAMPANLSRRERDQRGQQVLARVGLSGYGLRPIHSLSGGQKQRLAIASVLASGSSLLLLDEPTALLDPASQQRVLRLVRQLCDEGLTALWVTHRLVELDCCDGAFCMDAGRIGPLQSGKALRRSLATVS